MAIIDIQTHVPKNGEKYFLDCNVLMYIFYMNGSYGQDIVYSYSDMVSKIINAGAHIYISDMLISEFINTYVQTEFHRLAALNSLPHTKQYFKHTFKRTAEYHDILKEIKCILERQLFPISLRKDVLFSNISFQHIFDNPDTFDFNDRYYGLSFAGDDVYIISNDGDFSDIGQCNIITKNKSLLNTK